MYLLSEGKNPKEISSILGIKDQTVKNYMSDLYHELGMNGEGKKTRLAVWAWKMFHRNGNE